MEELKKYRLGELIDVTRGASLSGDNYATSGEYVRLTCGNFDYINNCFKENKSKENIYYIGSIREEFIMSEGDIITPLTEQAIGLLGSTALIPESNKYIQSQDIAKIVCKNDLLDHNYCFYLISSNAVKQQLSAGAQQTKIRHTSPDKIKDCTVWIPCIEKQKKIGNLLSNIDLLISTKRNENSTLEAMAKTLYDYWFVQFDFPNQDGKPYKSSGGKMVFNEILKREIPEGWEVKSVNEISVSNRGVSYKPSDLQEKGVLVLRGNNISNNHLVYDGNTAYLLPEKIEENQKIRKYDIIMTMSSGSKEHIGKCAMFMYDSHHTFGAFLNKFTAKTKYHFYLFQLFCSDYCKIKIKNICSGTGINNLTNETFNEIKFANPVDDSFLDNFNVIVNPIYEQIGNNNQQIQNLTSLRDYLLPLLMNGQVEVKDAEKKFQEIIQKMPMAAEEEAEFGR